MIDLKEYIGREDELVHSDGTDINSLSVLAIVETPDTPFDVIVVLSTGGTIKCGYRSSDRFAIKPKPKKVWYKLAWVETSCGERRYEIIAWHASEEKALTDNGTGMVNGPMLTWIGED